MLLLLFGLMFHPTTASAAAKSKQWIKKGSYRYYYDKNGKKVKNKVKKIGKHRYSFDEKGRMQTGWQVFGSKKAYFSKKSGKMLTNKTVSGIKIGKSGYVKRTRSELSERTAMEKANAILKKITNSGMTKREKLYAAYNYMSGGGGFYYCTWRAFQVYDGWEYDYATEIYEKRGGLLHTTSGRGEGYIAYKLPKEKPGFKTLCPIAVGMLRNSTLRRLVRFGLEMKRGGASLRSSMDKKKEPYIFVGLVCVRERYQGQGYMRKVMDIAFSEGNRLHVPVILETDARSKCDKYVHLGMQLAGIRDIGEFGKLYDLIKYPKP